VAITTISGAGSSDLTTLQGTELADTFALTANSLFIEAKEGADTVTAANAVDAITAEAGDGNDSLTFSGALTNANIDLGVGNDITSFQDFAGTLTGGSGNDTIDVNRGAASSQIKSGAGSDTFTFDTTLASSKVWGNSDDDTITVTGGTTGSTIFGGRQEDAINIAAATDSKIRGDKGNDTITVTGNLSGVVIQGNADNDQIIVSSASVSNSTVFGGQGADNLDISGGAMLVRGDDGADDIDITGNARYTISGGSGNDAIDSSSTSAVKFFGGKGNDAITSTGVTGSGNHVFSGDAGNDTLTGADDAESFDGGTGNDTITGGGGADTVFGKAGTDSIDVTGGAAAKLNILGGADNDTILVVAADLAVDDVIKGEAGSRDVLSFSASSGNIADAQFKGVSGIEALRFSGAQAASTFTLGANAQSAGITEVNLTGGTGGLTQTVNASGYTSAVNLNLRGGATNGSIFTAGSGKDALTLAASGGVASTLTGGAGIDTFTIANTGTTAVSDLGTGGADVFDIATTSGVVTFTVAANYTASVASKNNGALTDGLVNGSGFDVNLEAITTGGFGYVVTGTAASATLRGSGLADSITGGAATDSIFGSTGNDTLNGNGGNDTVRGGTGDDIIVADTTEVGALDSIDGGTGNDTIQLRNGTAAFAATLDMDRITNVLDISSNGVGAGGADVTLTFSPIAETTSQTVVINATSLTAGNGDLVIAGTTANDANGAGNSTTAFNITGGAANDTIRGGLGADTITSGAGVDIIVGGGGADQIAMGTAGVVETAIMTTAITMDTVTGYVSTSDLVHISRGQMNLAGGSSTGVTTNTGGTSLPGTNTLSVFLVVDTGSGGDTALTAGTLINLTVTGGYADLATAAAAVTGTNGIKTHATLGMAAGDSIAFQYENSTTSTFRVGTITFDSIVGAGISIAAADVTLREVVDAGTTELVAADVVFIA
jgi:Ca2+-binding RTX toxin-like protein